MVEIIPRPIKKIVRWEEILFYFLVFLIMAVIVIYFVLGSLQERAQSKLQDLEEGLSQGRTPQMTALEQEALYYKVKIDEFSPFLEKHTLSSKFFDFLESRTHPKIFFFQINLNPGNSKVLLSGLADSFLSLGQQLLILSKDPMVESINLSNVSLGETGGIEFAFDMVLAEEVFRY
ncbi:MAG: hypothetical protein ACKKMR_03165 [Candidatus Nealsonbacteria bacterium]